MASSNWQNDFETRLRAVDWNKLNHAYGSAGDVPDLLMGLITPQGVGAEMDQLWGNLYHQGTRYQATLTAIPFLVELLENLPEERTQLIFYLICLAIGDPIYFYPFGFRRISSDGSPELSGLYSEIYDCIQADAFPVFLRLATEDANSETQKMALWALGWFPEREAESRAMLEKNDTRAARFALEMLDNSKKPMRERTEEEEERDSEELDERLNAITD